MKTQIRDAAADALAELAHEVEQAVDGLAIETDIIARNPGISPFALDELLKYFRERTGDVEELLPADPSSNNAAKAYAAVFGRLCKRACPNLGPEGGRAFMLALLVTQWMRGYPLSRLIEERLKYLAKKGTSSDEAAAIRSVMNEVEQIARFEAPRGLSCYCDVLRQHLREKGRDDLLEQLPPFNVFLELGVSQQTQIALIGIGLTRTSAIALSELIASDSLTESQVLRWLAENEEVWRNFTLPVLVKKEIERVLAQHKVRHCGVRGGDAMIAMVVVSRARPNDDDGQQGKTSQVQLRNGVDAREALKRRNKRRAAGRRYARSSGRT